MRRTSSGWQAQVSLYTDDAGYFGRRCPDPTCRTFFKLSTSAFKAAPQSLQLTCPACGVTAHHERFTTPDQKGRSETAALELAQAAADQIVRDFSRQQGTQTFMGGRVEWTAHKNPPRIPHPLPSYVEQPTVRLLACPRGHDAVIYDLLAFCPWCGANTPPRAIFDDSLAAQRRLLALVEAQTGEERLDIEARGGVTALIERALTAAMAASQYLAKQLHGNAGKKPAPRNPWQNVDRLREQWRKDMGRDPLEGMDDDVIQILRLAFARRHLLEHNGGVVDDDYIKQTDQGILGRRIRISPAFVGQAFAAVEALADRLDSTPKR